MKLQFGSNCCNQPIALLIWKQAVAGITSEMAMFRK